MTFKNRLLTGLGLSLMMLILALSLQADEIDATPTAEATSLIEVEIEAAPTVIDASPTEVVNPPVETAAPATEEPAPETPAAVVTGEATPDVVVTAEPSITVTPIVTPAVDALPPEPVMALLARELFDNGDVSPWALSANWHLAAHEAGWGLQSINSNDAAVLLKGDFLNVAAQIRVRMQTGAAKLFLRQSSAGEYSVSLDANGQVDLYRGSVLLKSALVAPLNGEWATLRLSAVGNIVRVAVNDSEVIALADDALPAGGVAIAGVFTPDTALAASNTLWVDDFFLWVKADEVANYPAPTPSGGVIPPVITDAPPVVTDAPPVVTDAPPVVTDLPPVVTDLPPVVTDLPPVVTDIPPVVTDAPPVVTDLPPVVTDAPPVVTDDPSQEPANQKSREAVARVVQGANPAVNDNFLNSTIANSIPYRDTTLTSAMTVELQEPTPSCGFNITRTIWYTFTPTSSGKYILSTAQSNFDTMLVVYVGSAIDGLTQVACSDDAGATELTSSLTLDLTAGISYRIQVGGYNGLSGSALFSIKYANVPLAPAPSIFPAALSPTSSLQPLLRWTAVPGAALYDVELNTLASFGGVMLFSGQSAAPSQIPSSVLSPGVYYWRVRSYNINLDAGAWSLTKTLTINTTPPVLSAPLANESSTTLRPLFKWGAYPGATHYQLRIARDIGMSDVVSNPVLGTALSYQYPDPLTQGLYYWQISAHDASGHPGPYSAPRLLIINIATSFKDSVNVTSDTTPLFTWAAVPGASGYRLEMFTNEALTTPAPGSPFAIPGIGATVSFALPAPIANGDTGFGVFYWRINANVGGFPALPSTLSRKLTISPAAPATPKLSLTKPAPVTNDSGPMIEWTASTSTAGLPYTHDLQISLVSTFATQVVNLSGITTLNMDLTNGTLIAPGTYYARVRAVNKYGVAGLWSRASTLASPSTTPVRSFKFNITPPTPKGPLANSAQVTLTPTFSWLAYPGASGYQLLLARDSGMTTIVSNPILGAGLSYLYPTPLAPGVYYWAVRARDASANPGSYSAPLMFTINLALTPADNIIIGTIPTPFTWKAVTGAESYQLEMFTNAAMTVPAPGSPFAIPGGGAATSFALPAIGNGDSGYGVFYWRINVKMPAQSYPTLANTFFRKLTISPAAPGIPKFSLTKPAATTSDSGPVIEWTAPVGTSGLPFTYDLQISTVKTFATQIVNLSGLTALSEDLSNGALPAPGIYYARVRAVNKYGVAGAWTRVATPTSPTPTPIRAFVFNPAPPTPTGPLSLPNAVSNKLRPTFTWSAYPGAKQYSFLIGKENPIGTPVATVTLGAVTTYSYSEIKSLRQGVYYWQVSAQDANDHWTDYSALKPLIVNIALTPADNHVTASIIPPFTWEPITGAAEYRLEVFTNAAMTVPAPGSPFPLPSGAVKYTLPSLGGNGVFYWRINARVIGESGPDIAGDGFFIMPASLSRKLTISPAAPPIPTITAPAALTNDSSPTITWTSPVITDTTVKYDLDVSRSSTFAPLLYSQTQIAGPTATLSNNTLTTEGVYYARVRSVNAYGIFSKWVTRAFTYDITPLAAPALIAPLNGSSVTTTLPTFSWTPVKGSLRYEIQITADAIPVDPPLPPNTEPPASPVASAAAASYIPPGALLTTTYYWRVRSVDAANNPSAWSELRRLKVVSPPTAVPQLNRFVSTPTLSWTPISWVVSGGYYRVQIDNQNTFTQVEYQSDEIAAGTYSLEVPLIPALVDGTWYWRVSGCPPVSAVNLKCVWSATGSFVIDR